MLKVTRLRLAAYLRILVRMEAVSKGSTLHLSQSLPGSFSVYSHSENAPIPSFCY
jgi:hypothetical protein